MSKSGYGGMVLRNGTVLPPIRSGGSFRRRVIAPAGTIVRHRRKWYGGAAAHEEKHIDISSGIDLDTTGNKLLINGIARGDDITERIARRVHITKIQMRGNFYSTATTGVRQEHRFIMVYDKFPNGSAPSATDFLENFSTNGLYKTDNNLRFKILYDKVFQLAAAGNTGSQKTFKLNKRFKRGLITQFNSGDAGTVADIQSGAIYMFYVGNVAAGATAGGAGIRTRMWFKDY